MARKSVKICKKCVASDRIPSISVDDSGLCNLCRQYKTKKRLELREKYARRFADLVRKYKGKSSYDCVLAFSGGKDSSYTAFMLKDRYKLDMLVVSFDNWFQSHRAITNIRNVIRSISADHVTLLPSFEHFKTIMHASIFRDLYPTKALERASSICTTCLALIRFACFKVAIEKDIPFVVFGLSPGQAPLATSVFKTNVTMLTTMQGAICRPLRECAGDTVDRYFLENRHFEKGNSFPYIINPLAFVDYDEDDILRQIKELGWEPPEDTDPNSTNCLLNGFANQIHVEKHGYHPYTMEMAELVREGVVQREEALRRLSEPADPQIVDQVKAKLGL